MKIFTLLQTKYSLFENAVKTHISKALSQYGVNYGNDTIFGQLINVLGSTVQNIMLYIEDSMIEQNKYTAQRKKSIYGLAALSGYNPSLGQAANVTLSISYMPNNANSLDLIINNKESLTCTQNGLQYCLILPQEAIIMSPLKYNGFKYLSVVQGRFETQSFISIGGKYYTQNFNFVGNLDTKYLTIKVNNEKWEYAESFYDMRPDGKQWTYKISTISGIDIIFGNDKYGRSLKDKDNIEITYLLHDGDAGNLDINEETYFVFDNPLKDINGDEVDGNNIFNITFASTDSVTAGSNSESIEQVRQMIGLNSRSLVLASPNNYKELLNKISFCGYNRTWAEPGTFVIKSLIMKNYKSILNDKKTYFDLTEQDFKLTDNQKQSINNYIQNTGNQLAGVTYQICDPELCKYAMYVYLKFLNNNYEKEIITNTVRKLIGEFFSEVKSDIFIPKSDIIQLLKNNISDLDSVDVYFLSERNEVAIQTRQYEKIEKTLDPSLGTYKTNKTTVYLYPGENPNLGLDEHGNIYLESDEQFPVLMGGWDYLNTKEQEIGITDPLIIIFE